MAEVQTNAWRDRLFLPAYRVGEAARYARTSPQTVRSWQRLEGAVASRELGEPLSYLQLIEVGVVAAMRKVGVKLAKIRNARDYLVKEFKSEFPFAEYRFKTDGKEIFLSYDQLIDKEDQNKLLVLTENGQFAWKDVLAQLLKEFEYDLSHGTVSSWCVAGVDSPVRIDPRIAFGAPQVKGIATWVLRERWKSGESLDDIADDYCLESHLVSSALQFERVEVDPDRPNQWVH